MLVRKISVSLSIAVMLFFAGHPATAVENTYTSNSDFDQGIMEGLQYGDEDAANQLQLNTTPITFKFVNVPASKRSSRGTLVRINADTGEIIGEYWTAPQGHKGNPSRTSIDSQASVWVANSDEDGKIDGVPSGSVVKIGLVIGGTRVTKQENSETGDIMIIPDDSGFYLQGPFDVNTCEDRDQDGLIRTSFGLGDVLDWKDDTDSLGGADARVQDAEDECILVFQRLPHAENAQHVAVDANDDVWVGGYFGFPGVTGIPGMFYKLNGDTGAIVQGESFDAAGIPDSDSGVVTTGCGGFGGLIDDNGVLWSASQFQIPGKLLRYDPAERSGICIDITSSYGLAESVIEQENDTNVFIWNSSKNSPNQITKIYADTFQIVDGFPKSTFIEGDSDGFEDRGVAVTPIDNHVWLAKAGAQDANEVRRLDSDGNLLNSVVLVDPNTPQVIGRGPTGLAVDANGKIWVVNQSTNNVMRIDPAGDEGRGAVDLTVGLPDAVPVTYGDMAGEVETGTETTSLGTWTVITDGGATGTLWDTITWNNENEGSEPAGTSITVEAQAADSTDDLSDDANYEEVLNGELLSLAGQFIKVRVTLTPDSNGTSPVLSDLVIKSLEEEPAGVVCDVHENGSVDLFDILTILFALGDEVDQPFDPRDWNNDGAITPIDVKGCIRECTRPFCIPVDL